MTGHFSMRNWVTSRIRSSSSQRFIVGRIPRSGRVTTSSDMNLRGGLSRRSHLSMNSEENRLSLVLSLCSTDDAYGHGGGEAPPPGIRGVHRTSVSGLGSTLPAPQDALRDEWRAACLAKAQ